jgi:hypothetical protein
MRIFKFDNGEIVKIIQTTDDADGKVFRIAGFQRRCKNEQFDSVINLCQNKRQKLIELKSLSKYAELIGEQRKEFYELALTYHQQEVEYYHTKLKAW